MDVKFEFFDLNYLYFDTNLVQFGEICGLGAQTEVYYGLIRSRSSSVVTHLPKFGVTARRPENGLKNKSSKIFKFQKKK